MTNTKTRWAMARALPSPCLGTAPTLGTPGAAASAVTAVARTRLCGQWAQPVNGDDPRDFVGYSGSGPRGAILSSK